MNSKFKLYQKLLLSIIPLVIAFYSLQSLFYDVEYCLDPIQSSKQEITLQEDSIKKTEDNSKKCSAFRFRRGTIPSLMLLSGILNDLKTPDISSDSKLEKTIDRLERILLAHKIYSFINSFIFLLCISTLIAFWSGAWFSFFLAMTISIISTIVTFKNLIFSILIISLSSETLLGISMLSFQVFLFVITIWSFFLHSKSRNREEANYRKLLISGSEEDSTNIEIKPEKITISEKLLKAIKMVSHFLIIVSVGVLIGNIVYIPLFSLQKHYLFEFGFIIIGSIVLLSLFYIWNYYRIGKENNYSGITNLLVSVSFLQYRMLRNTLVFLISSVGVILFIIFLLSLLLFNTYYLQKIQMIEQSINL